ncbi:hypothetical protein L3Q82_003584 [Scortum barcoo]|uniref:Uncharacterized protein n=1 Tax=Scortum barcoo TaxID=214431 RepID=A0ACB8VMX7_9TELE|nr:hypothetical protein L3Q82_003584 [Scortum barcoo]
MQPNRLDRLHRAQTLSWNSCSLPVRMQKCAACMDLVGVSLPSSHAPPFSDAVMRQNTRVTLGPSERHSRGRGSIFNLTTEPVGLLLLPLRQFTRSLTIVPGCDSYNREVLCAAAAEVPPPRVQARATPVHDPLDEDLCVLTCLERCPVPGSVRPAMEHQAWILRSFLAQLECQRLEDEGAPNGIAGEFARLKSLSTKYRTDNTFPTRTAERQENVKKNRYKDIVPFDHSRVKLSLTTSKNDTDYINASFIKDSEENKGEYLTRTLRVTYRNCSRTLIQLHYINWPDHGVPDAIPPILEMLHEMRSNQPHDDFPICIHCSAGCGRTGALCVIDYTWNLLKKQMIPPAFSIYDLVQNMRTQRPSLVQTKEQYELVYRTIKMLFEKYLQSVDAQTCRNEVSVVPSAVTPDTESEIFDLDDEMDLLPQLQLLDEERAGLSQYHVPLPSASEHLIDLRGNDAQQQWHLVQSFPEAQATVWDLQEGPRTSPQLVQSSQRAHVAEEKTQKDDNLPSLKPPPGPAVAAAICMMVEDPYFDSPLSSPSLEEAPEVSTEDAEQQIVNPLISSPLLCLNDRTLELNPPASGTAEVQTDEEEPPPLPQRTPESYMLAVNTEESDPCERLMVIIPPSAAAAEAVRELGAAVEQKSEVTPAVSLSRLGTSSEWSGHSKPDATTSQNETKNWTRSKSLRAKMTFTVPVTHPPDCASNTTSHLHPYCPPQDSLTPSLLLQIQLTQQQHLLSKVKRSSPAGHERTALCPQPVEMTQPSQRVGQSSGWDGTSQPKKFLDVVKSRSKSVRAKSSRQEPLTVVRQLAPPPVVVAGGGSAQAGQHDVNRRASLNDDTSGSKSDKSNEKGMSRTRSLKFFRHKQKPKIAPPPPPTEPGTPPPSYSASFSVFKFGRPVSASILQ